MLANIVVFVWTLIIYTLMWMPLPGDTPAVFGHMDLLIHLGLFLILSGLVFYGSKPEDSYKKWATGIIFIVFIALSSELGQFFIPTRSIAAADLFVNFLGLAGALIIWSLEETYISRLAGILLGGILMAGCGGSGTLFASTLAAQKILLDNGTFFIGGIFPGFGGLYLISREEPTSTWKIFSSLGTLSFLVIISNPSHALFLFCGGIIIFLFSLLLRGENFLIKLIIRYLFSPILLCWFLLGLLPPEVAINSGGILIINVYFLLLLIYSLKRQTNYLRTVIPGQVLPE